MSKATTENDRSISTKIVAATFQNGIGPEEVSGEKICRNQKVRNARKVKLFNGKGNFSGNTFSKRTLNFVTDYFHFLKSEPRRDSTMKRLKKTRSFSALLKRVGN